MLSLRLRASVLCVLAFASVSCSSKSETTTTDALPPCPPDQATAPNELRCTGLYSDWAAKSVSSDVVPFKPGVELWSDGADKHRFVLLPKGSKIDTSNPDEWTFPVGTKTWKEFRVNGRRVETRFYWKLSASQWVWTTYKWSKDETHADRFDDGMPNAEGTYEIPKTSDTCDACHQGKKDKVLGIEAIALAMSTAEGLTLAKLKQDGMLSADVPAPQIPNDATGKAPAALAYMHMNCGVSCHGPAPTNPAFNSGLVLRLGVAELADGKVDGLKAYKTSVGVKIFGNAYYEYSGKGFLRIKPGVSQESLIPTLASLRNTTIQMPPIASHQPDPQGRGQVEQWIDAMPKN